VTTGDDARTERSDRSVTHLFGHGTLSYIQIPAIDVKVSAAFYTDVFGWEAQGGRADHVSFTDAAGHMIGAWVTGLEIVDRPGALPYVYVHGIDTALQRIVSSGGVVVKEPYQEGDLWVATFRDPAGNVIGIWQQGDR
jgi:hypothetical protein